MTRGERAGHRVTGPTRALLTAERTALNLLCRMSGVATHTRKWADALAGTGAIVLDTRKTTPGLRVLEKYAVRAGGGTNKRMGLYDVAMIKDNHKLAAGVDHRRLPAGPRPIPGRAGAGRGGRRVAEAIEAVDAGADVPAARQHGAGPAARGGGGGRRPGRAGGDRQPDSRRWRANTASTGVDYLSRRRSDPLVADPGHRAGSARSDSKASPVLLCIDIGNTNTVLATFEGDKIVHRWRVKTDARSTADELGLMFRGLLAGDNVAVSGIAACSTVPAALRSLRSMLDRYYPAVPDGDRRAGRTHRRPAGHRQPERGRHRPGGQHAGRAHSLRRTDDRGRLRHLDQLRRGLRAGASSSAACSRPASRSRSTRSPPAPPSCARWS